jgi:uncharacterized protein DUF932
LCYPTTERVVCANTFRVSTKDRGKGIGIRHTGSIKGKVESAKQALGLTVNGFKDFARNAAVLAGTPVKSLPGYVNAVLDDVLDVSERDARKGAVALTGERKHDISPDDFEYCVKAMERKIQSRGEILDDIITRFESERCRVNGIAGTLWAAMQACTESADYSNGKRHVGSKDAQASRKFESVLT